MVGGGGTETHCAIKYSDRSRTGVCVHTFMVYIIIFHRSAGSGLHPRKLI